MANVDNPNGFTPVRHLAGGTIRMEEFFIQSGDSGDATGIFSGDVMTMDTDGYADLAAVGDGVLGIFAGCSYTATDGSYVYAKNLPADTATKGSADITAYLYSDPMIVYAVQHDGVGALAENQQGYDIVIGTGDTSTGRSRAELDTTTGATSGQFKQLALVRQDDNAWGANAVVEVQVYESMFGGAASVPLA